MSEPKLLTEADVLRLWGQSATADQVTAELRERGLIAPEPDPMDAVWAEFGLIPGSASYCLPSERTAAFRKAMAIVGMELAQPPLTREMVRGLVIDAQPKYLSVGDFQGKYGKKNLASAEGFITRLHATLTERQP